MVQDGSGSCELLAEGSDFGLGFGAGFALRLTISTARRTFCSRAWNSSTLMVDVLISFEV